MSGIDRRDFLKLAGAGGAGASAGFMMRESTKHPVEHLVPYTSSPEEFSPGIATWYNTVCSMCSSGCGISVRTREGRAKKIEGNPSHPVSQGRLCAHGQAGLQVLYNPDRLTGPMARTAENADLLPITWEEGISQLATRLSALQASGQGDSVCFLSEGVDGHLAALYERFMAQLGSNRLVHYDFTHPRTLYSAIERLFGQSQLPYYDIGNADYVVSFGADYLSTWISPVHHSFGFGSSRKGVNGVRGRFVQIEPRMSVSGASADDWFAANPGTEGMVALAIANHIVNEGGYQGDDRDAWATALVPYSPDLMSQETGLSSEVIVGIAESFMSSQHSLAIGGGSAGNNTNGVDTLVAVNALNYLIGNLGNEGGLVLNPEPVVGSGAGALQATYTDMVELAEAARDGSIQVLILSGTNPVFNLPDAAEFREAIAQIPLVVSLSSFIDETSSLASLVLPSHTYLESWGDSFPEPGVGFTIGAISQPVVSPLFNTRAKGDIIINLAQEIGLSAEFPWSGMEEYLKEGWQEIYARGDIANGADGFESFWNDVVRAGVWGETTRGPSPVGLPEGVIESISVAPPEFSGSSDNYPFIFHPYLSDTLEDGGGANLPWLQELPDPLTSIVYGSWVELNPLTANELNLEEGDIVEVESPHGRVTAPVFVYPAIMPNVIGMPIGQGHTDYGRYASGRGSNPIQILSPQLEAETGGLAWAATRVAINPTGRRVEIVKTGGVSRELGREIIQKVGADGADHSGGADHAALSSIPVKVVRS